MTSSRTAAVGLLFCLAAGACAGYHPVPYVAGSALPARGNYGHGLPLETDYDSAADSTTVTVLLEKGRHFIRWHRPRVIAGFAYPGTWPQRMDSIFIEFRTQSPQYAETNRLEIRAANGVTLQAVATGSRIKQRTFTTDHTLTFSVPVSDILTVLPAESGELEVGGVKVPLGAHQFWGLRDLVSRMAPPSQ